MTNPFEDENGVYPRPDQRRRAAFALARLQGGAARLDHCAQVRHPRRLP